MNIARLFLQHMNTFLADGIHFIFTRCIKPRSTDDDDRRHEFILNIILFGSVILLAFLDVFVLISSIRDGAAYDGISFFAFTLLFLAFAGLLVLSRTGNFRIATYILIAIYFFSVTYTITRWGVELPLAGFGYALTIIMASVLVSTRFSFVVTTAIAVILITAGHLQIIGTLAVDNEWKHKMIELEEPLQLAVVLMLIATMSWLSNREFEHSLRRARNSEHLLKIERNSLETKVKERTRELHDAQREKIAQLYRFAEFGKLSSGIFHDLMNSLNSVVANVSQLQVTPAALPEIKQDIAKAVSASKRMSEFIATARKQMQTCYEERLFSLNKELRDAVDILEYRAREAHVELRVKDPREIIIHGNPLKFHQLAINLISNAIDACLDKKNVKDVINITLTRDNRHALFRVTDYGRGIAPELKDRIFDPFFTTKGPAHGIGLGLSTTKDVVEKYFHGSITVISELDKGSSFTIIIPLTREPDNSSGAHR